MKIFKDRLFALCCAILEMFLIIGLLASPAKAQTRVQGTILDDSSWTASASPYLLEDNVTIPDGVTLTIGPGVSVAVAPDYDLNDMGYEPAIDVTGGRISIQGAPGKRVSLNGIAGISVSGGPTHNGSADIADADLSGGATLDISDSRATLASSTIVGAGTGVWIDRSLVSIWGSRVSDNQTGMYVQSDAKIFLDYNDRPDLGSKGVLDSTGDLALNVGMDGNEGVLKGDRSDAALLGNGSPLALAPDLTASSSIVICGSSFTDNGTAAIVNKASYTIDAALNWWGSPSGPAAAGANSVQGSVADAPWLAAEPPLDMGASQAPCCSSILFLPGLEGTRLYDTQTNPLGSRLGLPPSVSQLWEPHSNSAVAKLDLDAAGSSTDLSVYSGGPIDKALGIYGVYGRFMGFLDGLVKDGTVNEWRAFGYDWRKPVAEVVAGSEKKATTTESLVQTVAVLAAHSQTGKVTIVAHSNGGLVAADLVKTLADMGSSSLIDSVISVAVPYLGTPSAIPATLNGYDQSIAYGLIATAANMRSLGIDMPSAYGLMPSRGFFSDVAGAFKPTIAYASTTASSYAAQSAYVSSQGNRALMTAADALHGILDPLAWPAAIARWAIVGWDNDTPRETVYSGNGYSVSMTKAGDGTVIAPSADYHAGQTVSVDLAVQSKLDKQDIDHANILESSTTEALIGSIVSNPTASNPASADPAVTSQISRMPGVTVGALDWAHVDDPDRELRITTHSPVALNVYDSHGDHTGEIPMPAQLQGQVDDGLYSFYENNIPGSRFDQLGDADGDGHADESVLVPDNGDTYTVALDGTAPGSFELDVERIQANSTIDSVSWKDEPVDSLTVASTTIMSGASSLASSTAALSIDIDGNGTVDATSSPNTTGDTDHILAMMEKACDSLEHSSARSQGFITRLENARSVWKAWQSKGTAASHHIDFEGMDSQTGHLSFKSLTPADRDRAFNAIDAFIRQFER